jgi:hypothetical protein
MCVSAVASLLARLDAVARLLSKRPSWAQIGVFSATAGIAERDARMMEGDGRAVCCAAARHVHVGGSGSPSRCLIGCV